MSKQKQVGPDIVIPIMGPTGAGKSTFINALVGKEVMVVGKTLSSCTDELGFVVLDPAQYPRLKDRIVIVDTPGFDDTYKGDAEILKKIADWLETSYKKNKAVLGGVIYLHDISNDRFTGTARRNLEMFQHLCGQDAFSKVILGTTKWGRTEKAIADAHQKELKELHWKSLAIKGARVLPFLDTRASAWSFVDNLVSNLTRQRLGKVYLQIQRELGDEKKIVPETEAGKELRFTLKEVLEMQQKMADLEKSMAAGGDEQARSQLQEAEEKIQKLAVQIKALKIPLSRRLRRIFGF
ncbi:P-loop containing nucleoside triphosphate hydrolase protein [Gymnopilus junonius]|uniref:P-loop containing nucleoside triphosphate hydrolase protein n=1 Tax=Gymnopilus junonius TaxID=109634 RepID=A0A9P5TJZ6_GYMJU|nr:P-loop containing nucleoside triphosphate hydrolase protein [Gymnopilus junonius]